MYLLVAIFGVPALLLVALIVAVIIGSLRKRKVVYKPEKKIIPPFEDEMDWGKH